MGSGVPGYNVSERYKMIWYAPERTGTRTIAKILNYYGFTCNGKPLVYNEIMNYSHYVPDVNLYSGYQTICTVRNPYSRTLSIFKNYTHKSISFKEFIFSELKKRQHNSLFNPIVDKPFNYVVKLENMYQDLLNIPFIHDKLTDTQLKYMCEHGKEIDEWESHYDDESKEMVYKLVPSHFEYFGYSK